MPTDQELTALLISIIARMSPDDKSDFTGDISKPYPNEHAARQSDPGKYKSFRRQNDKLGPGISVVFGITSDGKAEIQTIRFDSSKFTPEQARAWLKEHDFKTGLEPATGKTEKDGTMDLSKQDMYCNACGAKTSELMLSKDRLLLCCAKCAGQESQQEEPEPDKEEQAEPETKPDDTEEEKSDDIAKESFTDSPWSTPESNLSATDFCACALWDDNPSGAEKIKSKCHLPVRSRPGGPINRNALRNASARLNQVQGSSKGKASAKAKLARLMSDAGIESSLNKDDEIDIEFTAEIVKSDDEKRLVYGVSYPAKPSDWSDTQGDHIVADEIESMAHRWMIKSQQYDLQHQILGLPREQAVVVESYIAPVDFTVGPRTVTKGSWVVVTHFPSPDIWEQVKKGQINAYSIRGKAKRTPVV